MNNCSNKAFITKKTPGQIGPAGHSLPLPASNEEPKSLNFHSPAEFQRSGCAWERFPQIWVVFSPAAQLQPGSAVAGLCPPPSPSYTSLTLVGLPCSPPLLLPFPSLCPFPPPENSNGFGSALGLPPRIPQRTCQSGHSGTHRKDQTKV